MTNDDLANSHEPTGGGTSLRLLAVGLWPLALIRFVIIRASSFVIRLVLSCPHDEIPLYPPPEAAGRTSDP